MRLFLALICVSVAAGCAPIETQNDAPRSQASEFGLGGVVSMVRVKENTYAAEIIARENDVTYKAWLARHKIVANERAYSAHLSIVAICQMQHDAERAKEIDLFNAEFGYPISCE